MFAVVRHVPGKPANIAYLTLFFPGNTIAHVHVNWLAPVKVRRTLVGGSEKMLVYDDVSQNEKIRIYDKGVEGPARYDSFGEFHYSYRYGDIVTPLLKDHEPLRAECKHFVDSIRNGTEPRSSGRVG